MQEENEQASDHASSRSTDRAWVGLHFECCNVYTRIYRNTAGDAYAGYCPRCSKPVRLQVGPDGTDARFFRAQ